MRFSWVLGDYRLAEFDQNRSVGKSVFCVLGTRTYELSKKLKRKKSRKK